MNKSKNNKVNRIEEYRSMIAGLQANTSSNTTIVVKGATTTPTAIVTALQGYVDAASAVTVAQAAYDEAVARQDQAAEAAHASYLEGKSYALQMFGQKPTTLGTFGLQVPVRATPTAATKAAAAAKRKATLQARKAALTAAGTAAIAPAAPAPATGGSSSPTTTKS
jgi:hypothetical protein